MSITKLNLQNRWLSFLIGIVYWVSLDFGYRYYLGVGSWAHITDINLYKYIESLLIYLVLLLFSETKFEKTSDFFVSLLLYAQITPILVFYGFTDQSRFFLYVIVMSFVVINVLRLGKLYDIFLVPHGQVLSLILVTVGAFTVTMWFVISGAALHINFDFSKVYVFREITGDLINQGVFAYLSNWAYKVFGPVLLTYGLWRRNYLFITLALGLHLFWFGVSGHKSVLFFPFLIIAVFVYLNYLKSLISIPLAFSGLIFTCLWGYYGWGDHSLASLFIRRLFFVVADNTFQYFEFFSENPFVYWSQSITSSWIQYPYQQSPPILIGNYRYGIDSHVNNSFLSTGYMHAGLAGSVMYSVLVGLLLRAIDNLSSDLPLWVGISIVLVPIWTVFFSADLPTGLLTHGLGLSLVILFFIRPKGGSMLKRARSISGKDMYV